ncbi:hypothetical protein K503DRAFT_769773 [Rhizopogon vinicolor AM-OR11-026]|uniref:Uncharacterized protein n=1 Tax=Rhizopogon vinicolor AM-OR11-026 TaxID=1314800 RepID=A0A1B7N2S2_9AGAM|nr:hypothetical protein K503DRAFT_769773 [Rhizopogon vinicolor AM-OR11-026]
MPHHPAVAEGRTGWNVSQAPATLAPPGHPQFQITGDPNSSFPSPTVARRDDSDPGAPLISCPSLRTNESVELTWAGEMVRRRAECDDSQATESFGGCAQQTYVLKIRGTQIATLSLPRRERRSLRSASGM